MKSKKSKAKFEYRKGEWKYFNQTLNMPDTTTNTK
jgi:hypothetical protein